MNNYIKTLIDTNKNATENIVALEQTLRECDIVDEKTKANYGNLCIALKGYRMVAEATECMLVNENCLKATDGEFYQKVDTNGEFYQKVDTDEDKEIENPSNNVRSTGEIKNK